MHSSLRRWISSALFAAFVAATASADQLPRANRPQMDLPPAGEEVPLPKIRQICAHYGLHELWRKIEADPPPRPFKSDGCTGWFDDWKGVSLYPAGFLHDLKYWAGYPGEEVERLVADAELMIDVARLLGSTEMAETMFHGVRLGGSDKLNAPFSWGFGRRPLAPAPAPASSDALTAERRSRHKNISADSVVKTKLLFVCSRNQWHSPTAEALFRTHARYEARSAGTENGARIKLSAGLVGWADMIFAMEKKHAERVRERFMAELGDKPLIVVRIPDDFGFMDPALIDLLRTALSPHIDL